MKLTPSQKRSAFFGVLGAASALVEYAPQLEAAFPSLKWLAPAVAVLSLCVTMVSRSLQTSNSGTGGGLLESGPDLAARAASGVTVPPDARTGPETNPGAIVDPPAPVVGPPDAPLTPADVKDALGHD